jgi:hypothetical protein
MPATYEPIATTTLGSAAATITFSSIPATYTDLRLVLVNIPTASLRARLQINGDTGTNYSSIIMTGDGSTTSSVSNINDPSFRVYGTNSAALSMFTYDFFSYAGSTYKSILATYSGDSNGSGLVTSAVALWRSTSAINQLTMIVSTSTYAAGTTATLYGILKA